MDLPMNLALTEPLHAPAGVKFVRRKDELRALLASARAEGLSIGLVPTMGYLHEGHLSLLRAAHAECDLVVMSLFVNPSQFGPGEDLDRYPRDEARDAELADEAGVDLIYAPSVSEVYPDGFSTSVEVSGLTEVLCGDPRRRGHEHFRGVTTVVAKLFNTVVPDVAYFGQKDAQQVVAIRRMVRDLDIPVRIEVVPTVRDDDGLALSSRNSRLRPHDRARAVALHRGLRVAEDAIGQGERDPARARAAGRAAMTAQGVDPEYFAIVDPDTLGEVERIAGRVLIVVAARVGPARLIDNVLVDTQEVATQEEWAPTSQRSSHVHPAPT
jgi:pantoate--beta-alanine ligase